MGKILNLTIPFIMALLIVGLTFLAGKNYGEINFRESIDNIMESREMKTVSDFKIYTKAVCSDKSNLMECKDELFIKCNGLEHKLSNLTLGYAQFQKNSS